MKELIIEKLTDLATTLRRFRGAKIQYEDDDLVNAIDVFGDVMMSKTFDAHKEKLTDAQMTELAHELGDSIRQTVLLFMGKDTFELAKKYGRVSHSE